MPKQEFSANVETITPEYAQRLLENNPINRKPSQNHVNFLQSEIEGGRWRLNGEAIIINTADKNKEKLMNGQHRLRAVVAAKKPIKTLVVRGVDAEAFATVDTGNKRTLSDVLSIRGEAEHRRLAGALTLFANFSVGAARSNKGKSHRKLSIGEMEDILKEHPKLRDSVPYGRKPPGFVKPSDVIVAHYLFASINRREADTFINQLLDGTNVKKGSPVSILRDKLVSDWGKDVTRRRGDHLGSMIKAWNCTREKKPCNNNILRIRTIDAFPKPV